MNAGLNRCTSLVQTLVTATIILVGMNSAQAQNPADLIPPAPDSYAAGNTLNTTLNYTNSLQPKKPQTFSAQNPTATYRVIIPSDNSTLLDQAKAIEPTAFLQLLDGQRVIQVGLFGTEALALQQIARFQAVGMPVRMQQGNLSDSTTMPTTGMPTTAIAPPASYSSMPPNLLPVTASVPPAPYSSMPQMQSSSTGSIAPNPSSISSNIPSNKGFYVIIPTVTAEVNYVQSQLNQVGIPPQYILFRDRPFGLHYAIGTFSRRAEAERLSEIIRDRTKFDARVYHER